MQSNANIIKILIKALYEKGEINEETYKNTIKKLK